MIRTQDQRECHEIAVGEEVTYPVYRCKWCQPHRWFMRGLDGKTMYVAGPEDGRIPSDGICNRCDDKMRKDNGMPPRSLSPQ